MVVYVDIIFLLNFLMDAAMIKTTAWAGKTNVRLWRLVLASLIGAAYVILIFIPSLSFMFTFAAKFLFSMAMTYAAFGFGSLQRYARLLGLFYAVNFVAAGGVFAVHYMLQSSHDVMDGIVFAHTGGEPIPASFAAWFVLLIFFAVLWLYRMTERSRDRMQDLDDCLADVHVTIDQYETDCRGLIDTGNRLYDPLTRTPVMVMDSEAWADVIPERWTRVLKSDDPDEIMRLIEDSDLKWRDRLRIVPYNGFRQEGQFMMAFKPDKVVIQYRNAVVEPAKVLIGLNGGRLSSDGSYEAIIHPDLV